jgi:mono/diheme cytochrome c family protein
MRAIFSILLAGLAPLALAAEATKPEIDPASGMKIAPGWDVVRNHCVICHSSQTFLRQRATEANWTSVLDWMQTKGGLWKLEPAVEKTIVQYLATNYGPGDNQNYRRAPIPALLMPPNPYASEAKLEAEAKQKAGLPAVPPLAPRPVEGK